MVPGMMRKLVSSSAGLPTTESVPAHGGLRTIVLSDIVGHTEMMQRLGDAPDF